MATIAEYEATFPNDICVGLRTGPQEFFTFLKELVRGTHNLSERDAYGNLLCLLADHTFAEESELGDLAEILAERVCLPSRYGVRFLEKLPEKGTAVLHAFACVEPDYYVMENMEQHCLVNVRRSPHSSPSSSTHNNQMSG